MFILVSHREERIIDGDWHVDCFMHTHQFQFLKICTNTTNLPNIYFACEKFKFCCIASFELCYTVSYSENINQFIN